MRDEFHLRICRPGDSVVLAGSPGHAVLILDVARSPEGKLRALLGRSYMPAQSFHVLRGSDGGPWFSFDGPGVQTPFSAPFPWEGLRRLE